MDIASSIIRLRTSRLYTRKALAEKAGIDLRHLIAVEEGRAVPTDYDIEAISRAFNVKPSDWIK
jgi:transcriptional regulator with XRE-family HTH domain